jgi:hypothetical protein
MGRRPKQLTNTFQVFRGIDAGGGMPGLDDSDANAMAQGAELLE